MLNLKKVRELILNLLKIKIMKREQLLNTEETKKTVIDAIIAGDKKFIKRSIQKIEDSIEDAEEELRRRLMADTAIDESVVEVMFKNISVLKEKKKLYESFQSEFLG